MSTLVTAETLTQRCARANETVATLSQTQLGSAHLGAGVKHLGSFVYESP